MLVSGVPRSAKPIVRGSAVALFERFRLICSLLIAAIMPSMCNTPACGGVRESVSCSSPSEERTLRHHAAGIQVAALVSTAASHDAAPVPPPRYGLTATCIFLSSFFFFVFIQEFIEFTC